MAFSNKFNPEPVLSWKTMIGEIKNLPKGSRVGYDGTEILEKKTKIAICPVGYWHGFLRDLSCKAKVLVNGKKCKVLGRVCMDIIMIDVSDVEKIKVGDEVVIIGESGKEKITVDDMSSIISGSSYEFLTRINPLIKRFYI
jgi:alanine racemase